MFTFYGKSSLVISKLKKPLVSRIISYGTDAIESNKLRSVENVKSDVGARLWDMRMNYTTTQQISYLTLPYAHSHRHNSRMYTRARYVCQIASHWLRFRSVRSWWIRCKKPQFAFCRFLFGFNIRFNSKSVYSAYKYGVGAFYFK